MSGASLNIGRVILCRQKALYEAQLQDESEEQRQRDLKAREAQLEAFDRQNNGALPTASERRLEEQEAAAFHGASSKKVRAILGCLRWFKSWSALRH